jgi:glycosyltransferase involved in cell wall biosynthesis
MKALLTILIPTFNREDRLRKTLPYFLKEKSENIEFLVCDNGSTDGTESYIKKVQKKEKRLNYVKNHTNIGMNRNIFRGFLEAKTNWISIFSDDDYIEKGFLSELEDCIEQNPNCGLVISSEKRSPKKFNKTTLIKKGVKAIETSFIYSGSIMAFTFDKTKFNQQDWNLDNSIYPQIRIGVNISLNHDVVFLVGRNKPIYGQWNDSIISISKSRTLDYGLFERVDILQEVTAKLEVKKQQKMFNKSSVTLFNWAISKFIQMYYENENYAMKYFKYILRHKKIGTSAIFFGVSFVRLATNNKIDLSTKIQIYFALGKSGLKSIINPNFYSSLNYMIQNLNYLIKKI